MLFFQTVMLLHETDSFDIAYTMLVNLGHNPYN